MDDDATKKRKCISVATFFQNVGCCEENLSDDYVNDDECLYYQVYTSPDHDIPETQFFPLGADSDNYSADSDGFNNIEDELNDIFYKPPKKRNFSHSFKFWPKQKNGFYPSIAGSENGICNLCKNPLNRTTKMLEYSTDQNNNDLASLQNSTSEAQIFDELDVIYNTPLHNGEFSSESSGDNTIENDVMDDDDTTSLENEEVLEELFQELMVPVEDTRLRFQYIIPDEEEIHEATIIVTEVESVNKEPEIKNALIKSPSVVEESFFENVVIQDVESLPQFYGDDDINEFFNSGYPDFMSFSEFLRRFDILVPKEEKADGPVLDEKQAAGKMAQVLELEERSYKLGLSNVFFRAGILAQLEDTRDDKLSHTIIEFQAYCRGILARKQVKQKEFQLAAITCIQRNVRNYMQVHTWSWWRLYTKVLPLLDVHKTERELELQRDETSALKQKVEKLTKENQTYSEENSRLKKKVQELSHQLGEFHSSVAGTNDLLAEETSERERLEVELERAKEETELLLRQRNMLESEIAELKTSLSNGTYRSHSVDDDANDDDYDEEDEEEIMKNDTIWRNKYMEKSRELEKTRREMTNQAEEEIQELMNQKRMADKALSEERTESDEIRRQLTNSKRKVTKMQGELDDMKLLLEGLQSRNTELEKKQRKFDIEMNNLHDELDQEITSKENAERERDKYYSEKHNLQNRINTLEDDVSQYKRKVERLNQEIDEQVSSGNADAEITSLKRQLREQETKLQDQEEELDEQAGQIQQLEQAKLKVDMASQRDKQQFQRDIEAKDEEIEQARIDNTRKLRALEEQIEDEVHKKEEVNKIKRDLERKIFDLENSAETMDKSNERKLKKALKKYRMLYKDAKAVLSNNDSKQGENALIKALRVQLEDADFSRHMAIKSKQQIESDMEELHKQIDNLVISKENADEKCLSLTRDNGELLTRIDELEDEIEEAIRKNKHQITQVSEIDMALVDMREKNRTLEEKNDVLEEKVKTLTNKLSNTDRNMVDRLELERVETKVRELESRLENEGQIRIKLEHQVKRFREQIERMQDEKTTAETNCSRIQQNFNRTERQVKEVRAELESVQRQEAESKRRREEAENRLLLLEDEISQKKNELTSSEKRIRDLQEQIENDINGSSDDDDIFSDSVNESDDSMTSLSRRPSLDARRRRQLSRKLSSDSFETPMSSYNRLRRSFTSDESYPSTNGYMSRDASRYTSRTTSRRISRQGSRQEPNYD